MNKYYCPYRIPRKVIELENFKECKKSYTFIAEKYDSDFSKRIAWKGIVAQRVLKENMHQYGFFVDAESYSEAETLREKKILEMVEEEMPKYKESVEYSLNIYHDSIFGIDIPNGTDGIAFITGQKQYNEIGRLKVFLNTIFLTTETDTIRDRVLGHLKKIQEEISERMCFKNKITIKSWSNDSLVNLDHPMLTVSLYEPSTLMLQHSNCRTGSLITINTNKKDRQYSSIRMHNIGYDKYNELKERYEEKKFGETDMVIMRATYKSIFFSNGEYKGTQASETTIDSTMMYNYFKKKKAIIVEMPRSILILKEEAFTEYFRIKDGELYIPSLEDEYNGIDFTYLTKALRSEFTRDQFNIVKLLSEVGE